MAFDRSGVGDAVGELMPAGAVPILITAGSSADLIGNCWHIGKIKLIEDLLHLARAGRLVVASDCTGGADFKRELMDFKLRPGARGRVRLEARSGARDDLVAAAAIAVAAARIGKASPKRLARAG